MTTRTRLLVACLLSGVAFAAYQQVQQVRPPTNLQATPGGTPLEITGPAFVDNGVVRQPWSIQWQVAGGRPPYAWSIAGELPPGITLNAQTGLLSGTPLGMYGPWSPTVTVTDAMGATAAGRVDDCHPVYFMNPLVVTTPWSDMHLYAGVYNGFQLQAVGWTSRYTWSLYSGALPPNMTLSPSGIFQGYPTAGNYTFQVKVTDPGPDYPMPYARCTALLSRVRRLWHADRSARAIAAPQSVESTR